MNTIAVRSETPQDEAFLIQLYAGMRGAECVSQGCGDYHVAFPNAEFQIVLCDGVAAGRLVVHRTREALRLVDIALLPQYRNTGVGAALMQRVLGEAMGAKKPLWLEVRHGSPAEFFFQRLGFVKTGETEWHWQMEWRAPDTPPARAALPDAVKLPFQFDVVRLQADLAGIVAAEFVPHFNQAYYQGDWSAVPLRSIGGRPDHIYPDPTAKNAYADTPLLARCAGVREVLATLACPLRSVRFLRLKAGSSIKEHRDYELGFEDGEVRLHIPVVTNPQVEFVLNQVRIVMQAGECWYLNVNQPHRVANRGAADRIHLVVDCVVNDWLRERLLAAGAA